MRRLIAPLVLLLAMLAVPATGHAASIGISDQQASTFTNPLFAPLKIKSARYITPYDVMSSPTDKAALDAWIAGARAANQRILVAFERSRQPGRERHLPSVSEYRAAVTAFHAAYPDVKEISVWNEVNRCQSRTRVAGQPTCRKETRLASYYKTVRRVFRANGTRIVSLDVLDEQNVNKTINVMRRFRRALNGTPAGILGFHNYSDTNRFSTTRTRRVLANWRGKVWLTETGGIVKLGRSFPRSTTRAARALGCMFTMGRSYSRIQRLYIYQFNPAFTPTDDFDAGLINADQTIRPGYNVVKERKRRSCRR
jgi:Glycosyl hydrolase catalytic core